MRMGGQAGVCVCLLLLLLLFFSLSVWGDERMIQYKVWYDMVWYGTVRYGLALYGILRIYEIWVTEW